ncbi:hypothetical protein BY996DRAFT_7500639 [Phakopsora pachyrhizi]|nr:hypothetical protein BY996DRAFT_7500639 [Phakopsora pachyrhizi]
MVGFFQVPMLNLGVFKSLIPLISINVCGLVFNTYCLQYVDTSFYQVARGLVLPSTVLASYLLLGIKSSPRIHLSTFVVCIGFMVGVSSERMTVSSLGVFLGILSSITTSLHAIAIKSSLNKVSTSTLELTYFTNLLSSVFVIPIVIITGEIPVIFNLFFGKVSIEASSQTIETGNSLNDYDLRTFVVGTLVTGFFGFLISLAGFLSIKVTSPVTHMISSAIRGVIQTALGALIFNDQITFGRLSGIVIILGGSIYYTFVKDQELYNKPNNSYYQPIKESQPMVELYKKEEIQSNVTAPRLEVAIEAAEEEQQGLIRGNQDEN